MSQTLNPYTEEQIERRLGDSVRLPSLRAINLALQELLSSETSDIHEIGDIIQRDPSMTARILRMVNSVSFGINYRVQNVQEAVLFLGIRHVRQVALLTPVIDEFQRIPLDHEFSWRSFWKHCLSVALISQEIMLEDDPDLADVSYIAGLIHDLGKIATAHVFPDHFHQIYILSNHDCPQSLQSEETLHLGRTHAEIGSIYARIQKLENQLCEAIEFHHNPSAAPNCRRLAAAVQLADGIAHLINIGFSGLNWELATHSCLKLQAWKILFPAMTLENKEDRLRKFMSSAGHLHDIVDSLV